MKWFGPPGGAGFEADCPHVAAPADCACDWCGELVSEEDGGVLIPLYGEGAVRELAYHHECNMRKIVGGLNHLLGRCICCGGTENPDPSWLTLRQGAVAAVHAWERQQGLRAKT